MTQEKRKPSTDDVLAANDANWLARERALRDERARRGEQAENDGDARFGATLRRMLARATDDGTGKCRACGVALVATEMGPEHPDTGCAGPRPNCDVCGEPYAMQGGEWRPTCTADDHARLAAQRRARAEQNTKYDRAPDMLRPPRAGSDDDDTFDPE